MENLPLPLGWDNVSSVRLLWTLADKEFTCRGCLLFSGLDGDEGDTSVALAVQRFHCISVSNGFVKQFGAQDQVTQMKMNRIEREMMTK